MHVEKYSLNNSHRLIAHNLRHVDKFGKPVAFGNSEIDINLTPLNYRLDKNGDPYEYLKKRLSEVKVQKRADVKVYCSWVITAPKDLPEDKHRQFFESVYDFFCSDYGEANVVMASVHMDETTPHMHLGFVPVVKERKNKQKLGIEKCSAKELLTRTYLKNVHKRLKNVLEERLQCPVGICITEEENASKRSYVPLKELKKKVSEEEKKLPLLQAQNTRLADENHRLKQINSKLDAERQRLESDPMPIFDWSVPKKKLLETDAVYASRAEEQLKKTNEQALKALVAKADSSDKNRIAASETKLENQRLRQENAELKQRCQALEQVTKKILSKVQTLVAVSREFLRLPDKILPNNLEPLQAVDKLTTLLKGTVQRRNEKNSQQTKTVER